MLEFAQGYSAGRQPTYMPAGLPQRSTVKTGATRGGSRARRATADLHASGCYPPQRSKALTPIRPLAWGIRVLRTKRQGSGLPVRDRSRRGARHEFTRQKKKRADCVRSNQLSVKKFPAPCYSPIVKFTVPSPLEALTTVFGKGTCVTPPPWAPENIPMKKSKS